MTDKFWKKKPRNRYGRPKYKYPQLENPWNKRYSRMKAQAKYRGQEWNLAPDEYMQIWEDSGVKEHCGKEPHHYCMVRKDAIESWSLANCIIVQRRTHFKKLAYEGLLKMVEPSDWQDRHGVKKDEE